MRTLTGYKNISRLIWNCEIAARTLERSPFRDLVRRSFFGRGAEMTKNRLSAIRSRILRFLIMQFQLHEPGILEKTDSKSSFRQRLQPSFGKTHWQLVGNSE